MTVANITAQVSEIASFVEQVGVVFAIVLLALSALLGLVLILFWRQRAYYTKVQIEQSEQRQNNAAQTQIAQMTDRFMAKSDELQTVSDALKDQLNEYKILIIELRAEVDKHALMLENARRDLVTVQDELDAARIKIVRLQEQVEKLESDLRLERATNVALTAENTQLRQQVGEMQGRISELEKKVEKLEQEKELLLVQIKNEEKGNDGNQPQPNQE